MRIYHLTSERWALESLRLQRLKLALLEDMNDPFELLGVELRTREDRRFFQRELRPEMNRTVGVLCFSRTWDNPVLWSHYADKHRGICLGFDVPDELLLKVRYVSERLPSNALTEGTVQDREEFMKQLLGTKFAHWKYESEVRIFVKKDTDTGLHFTDFSDNLTLKEIIVGMQATTTEIDIDQALGEDAGKVEVFAVRAAFKSFKVKRSRIDGQQCP